MHVIALVSIRARHYVRTAMRPADKVHFACDLAQFATVLAEQPEAVAIVEPGLADPSRLKALVSGRTQLGLPSFACTPLGPSAAVGVVDLLNAGAAGVILHEVEDGGEHCRALLDQAPRPSPAMEVLRRVADTIGLLPDEIAMCMVRAFVTPAACTTPPKRLASEIGRTRRTIDRWMVQAGLAPFAAVMSAARLAHALPLLRPRTQSIRRVAFGTGFETPGALQRHCKRVTGLALAAVESHSADDLLERIVGAVRHRPHLSN